MAHKHTPGPWKIEFDGLNAIIRYSDSENVSHVARLYDGALCEEHGTVAANAALIARAPDLLTENEQLRAINADLIAACQLADISEHKLLSLTHQQLINYVRDVRMTAVSATEAIARTKAQS